AAGLLHDVGGIALECVAEGVVGSEEEPVFAAVVHHGRAGAASQCGGIVGVVHGIGRALGIGEIGGGSAHRDEGLFLFSRDTGHGQRGTGVRAADQDVDLLFVEPFASAGRGNVGLVLVIGNKQLDLLAVDIATHVLDGHPDGITTGGAVDIGIDTRHVGDEANTNDVVGNACRVKRRDGAEAGQSQDGGKGAKFHRNVSLMLPGSPAIRLYVW